jgi:hypothetical protein
MVLHLAFWRDRSVTPIVLPNPAVTEMSVTPGEPPEPKPSPKCLIKRGRSTRLGRVRGISSLVAKIGAGNTISLMKGR